MGQIDSRDRGMKIDKNWIGRDIGNHSVFRTALYVFRYDEMSLTVLKERPFEGSFIQTLAFVQPVNSKKDAVDFIASYLDKIGMPW
jgi:hypothetical protein